MSKGATARQSDFHDNEMFSSWNQFWFRPEDVDSLANVRGGLALLAILFFLSAWSDVSFWYVDGPFTVQNVSSFLASGDLESAGRWIISPLFFSSAAWFYYGYLAVGILAAVLVILGRGGRTMAFALWLLVIGWANRSMVLSGLAESLLSLGLFATAIAPPRAWRPWISGSATEPSAYGWTSRFSGRLLATQITVVGLATFVTMLAGNVWFNGIGAYALAAPAQDRTIDWTASGSPLIYGFVHESLTHLMVIALPLGFAMAWGRKTNRIGQAVLLAWCLSVALLGSHWLYAATFAAMVMAIRPVVDPPIVNVKG